MLNEQEFTAQQEAIRALNAAWKQTDYVGKCPVRQTLDRIGDKWTVLVVLCLGQGPQRFREILRNIEVISQRMLTVTLRGLERDGLVTRTVFDTRPPTVEYELTDLGKSLFLPLMSLADWAIANEPEVNVARQKYDAREQ